MSKAKVEKVLRENGHFLTRTTAMEKASKGESEGRRWRIGQLTKDGYGCAGGKFFRNLEEVGEYVSYAFC